MFKLKVYFLCAIVLAVSHASDDTWSYGDADMWGVEFPLCKGSKQSPINLDNAMTNDTLQVDFHWERKHPNLTVVTTKNKNGIEYLAGDMAANIDIDGENYRIHEVRYHWGPDSSVGSEHSIQGNFFSGEIQFIHYNTKYASYEESKDKADGLAIVSLLLNENSGLDKDVLLLEGFKIALKQLVEPQSTRLEQNYKNITVAAKDLIPGDREYFYYKGSLSTPPCTEGIERIVFKTPLDVTTGFMNLLRSLKLSETTTIEHNHRPVQSQSTASVYKGVLP